MDNKGVEISPACLRSSEDPLNVAIEQVLRSVGISEPLIVIRLDQTIEDSAIQFSGIEAAEAELRVALQTKAKPLPMLIVGGPQWGALAEGRTPAGIVGQRTLFRWPGVAYLSHGFGRDELLHAARLVCRGADAPVPALAPSENDVLASTSEIRHWLVNRRRNTEGAILNFDAAGRGERVLHVAHLEPLAAISDPHLRLLDRFKQLLEAIGLNADLQGEASGLFRAISNFESRWLQVEAARSALRAVDHATDILEYRHAAVGVAEALRGARTSLTETVDSVRALEAAVRQAHGGER